MREKLKRVFKSKWFIGVGCLVIGAIIVLGIRFVTYKPEQVHYHANFALYVNGQHEPFKGPQNYEETEMCAVETTMSPSKRAHMHDHVNNVVHVEDHAVTWGQFFENLGWYIGPDFVQGPDGTMYKASGNSKLHIILNGQDYTGLGGITNSVIKDKDRLLVSFGDESNVAVTQQYNAIPSTAAKYDASKDTGSCGSQSEVTTHDRLTHLL